MTVSHADVIDFVAQPSGDSNAVHLVIIDDLEWTSPEEHLAVLKNKVNAYVHVLVSGQLGKFVKRSLPPNPAVTVVLVAIHAPPTLAKPFFERVAEVLGGMGAQLRVVSASAFEELLVQDK